MRQSTELRFCATSQTVQTIRPRLFYFQCSNYVHRPKWCKFVTAVINRRDNRKLEFDHDAGAENCLALAKIREKDIPTAVHQRRCEVACPG